MTLFRQLMITIIIIFSLMLVVVMGINFNTTKGYLIGQLESTTHNSATSLSMSVSDFMAFEDYVSVDSSVQAVFDSGYFSEVRIHVYQTDDSLTRSSEIQIQGVPDWFIRLVDFEVPVANAVISNGWSELGQVYITGSAGYGYYQLWSATRDLLISFFAIAVATLILGSIALRYLFTPLAELEKQAEAIQQRRFIKMAKVPKTRELRSVVLSMNRMAEKLEKEFAAEVDTARWLQAKAFKDSVSGLGNRYFFENQMKSHFSERERGLDSLVLISLSDLMKLNNERGYESADMFIQSAADILADIASTASPYSTVARLSGADFVLLIPNYSYSQLGKMVQEVMQRLAPLHLAGISYSPAVANVGAIMLDSSIERGEAMSNVGIALREAKKEGDNAYKIVDIKTNHIADKHDKWKGILEKAVRNRAFGLKKQKVLALNEPSKVFHEEIFINLTHEGNNYHAGHFIGLAQQFGISCDIDKVVIESVLQHIKVNKNTVPLAVNLSSRSYAEVDFMTWLKKTLTDCSLDVKSKFVVEISEQSALTLEKQTHELMQLLKEQGVSFGIDNVGKQMSAFHYLQTLMPDYVKIDSSYTRMAVGKEAESFFMHTLCKVFNSLSIDVIATGVENEKQLETLARFDVSGGQGYYIANAEDL